MDMYVLKLLLWCAILHLRTTPLTAAEADEIDSLIAIVRQKNVDQWGEHTP